MQRTRLSNILFWSVAGVASTLFVFLLLALAGVLPVDDAGPPPPAEEGTPSPATTVATTEATTEAATVPERPRAATTTAAEPTTSAPTLTSVVITATRGASWFSARVASESGRVLDERVLEQGESAEVEAARVWLTVGAAGNVDVLVNGKPRPLEAGTIALVLTTREGGGAPG